MKRKRIWTDPSIWVLVGVNAYLVYYYYHQPQIFTTLIWLYWAQSVSLGVFNFFDLLTLGNSSEPFIINDKPVNTIATTLILPFFFLLHYGIFHLVYFGFIFTMKSTGPFQWDFFRNFLFAFIAGQLITFIQHKVQQRKTKTNAGIMFFTPYLRIIPMHLTILAPAFLHIGNMGLFLILKAVTDVAMAIVTRPAYKTTGMDATVLASEQIRQM
jgi:hypothetical protein